MAMLCPIPVRWDGTGTGITGKRGVLGRFSFGKADRLLKRKAFLSLSRNGKRAQNHHFIAVFSPSPLENTRLGITVTKRVGKAVTRNRIKRLVREYFRVNKHGISGNWDINIIAKKEAANLSSAQAFESLQNIFKKISG